ncbi:MAG TPA: peptidoglycan DD-metalloendopeptidase family protein [Candidatus Limnocylindrales bacterium]|nr:peptidoglycan DD-metalloendopeptidase family protein [Candidatus Limnocylindrales bacterium]
MTSSPTPRRRRRILPILVLLIPLLTGLAGAPVQHVAGDQLSDAIARQKALERQIAAQKHKVAELAALQGEFKAEIARTSKALAGINADLFTVRKQVTKMVGQVAAVKSKYQGLVDQLKDLDKELVKVEMQEAEKRQELGARRALLAERLRSAYDTDQTSLLETFLSGASFTDVLTQVSYYIDVGEQDKALATQIMNDQTTLASLHQTVVDTRTQTDEIRKVTAAKKRELDADLRQLKQAQAALAALERKTAKALAAQKAAYARAASAKSKLRKSIAQAASAQRALARKIDAMIRAQASHGRIPSRYNGTLAWPMGGSVTQNFGCTGFSWEPPLGSCAHFHQGIDLVAPAGTPVHASGPGRVVYVGWNWADGSDPAWIVIIAHAGNLQTWYAHMQARYPVRNGQWVYQGQVIGYEGNTGHSTGAHLHWAVRRNGVFVNPRLFL